MLVAVSNECVLIGNTTFAARPTNTKPLKSETGVQITFGSILRENAFQVPWYMLLTRDSLAVSPEGPRHSECVCVGGGVQSFGLVTRADTTKGKVMQDFYLYS
jgi:hypothetical protein